MTLLFTVTDAAKPLPHSFPNCLHVKYRMCAWQDCYWRMQA